MGGKFHAYLTLNLFAWLSRPYTHLAVVTTTVGEIKVPPHEGVDK